MSSIDYANKFDIQNEIKLKINFNALRVAQCNGKGLKINCVCNT